MLDPRTIEGEVIEFFFVFSRFEFALKEAGYVFVMRNGNAAADWDGFVKKYNKEYKPAESVQEAFEHLTSTPPKRQKAYKDDTGKLRTTWERFEIDPNALELRTLVDIVKIIRNNLFHGGKYGEEGWDDERRVSLLLTSSTSVIRQWLQLEGDLDVYFNDWA